MHQPVTFGCQTTRTAVGMAQTVKLDCLSLHCDLDREHSKPIFSRGTTASFVKKVQQFRKYRPDKHLKLLILLVTLTLNTAIQFFDKTLSL